MSSNPGFRQLAGLLESRRVSCAELLAERMELARAADGVFTLLDEDVLKAAGEVDRRRASGNAGPLEGIPVTLKDLYNVRGQQTLAGSSVLRETAPPEPEDAEVVAHLRRAGLLFLGRTNMSEFAFSGMGLNPHYPPLHSVWDRQTGRLPGGSSSGSAVSVALGIVPGTLGSDTAGSCRIPAAFNAIVGVKPSYGRLSLAGVYPLSPSSDAPGPLGVDVDTCFLLDHLMAGGDSEPLPDLQAANPDSVRLLVPDGVVMNDLDNEVAEACDAALGRLENAGMVVESAKMPVVDDCIRQFLERPVVPFEAWRDHEERLRERGEEYDPYVRRRMSAGSQVTAEEQEQRYREKSELVRRFHRDFAASGATALVCPTVACVPPTLQSTRDPERIGGVNLRCLRNTAAVNYFDGCAISLPCNRAGEAPVGLMLSMPNGADAALYALAASVEQVLQEYTG
jgi:aspartyl-tRNA(Asn)/glutamyl-tRNA(Gln) amidotransferase subunit A